MILTQQLIVSKAIKLNNTLHVVYKGKWYQLQNKMLGGKTYLMWRTDSSPTVIPPLGYEVYVACARVLDMFCLLNTYFLNAWLNDVSVDQLVDRLNYS